MEQPSGSNEWRLFQTTTAGGAGSVTKAAAAGQKHVVTHIAVSVDGAPTAGAKLNVNAGDGPRPYALLPIAAGNLITDIEGGYPANAENTALVVATDAGGGAVVTTLLVLGYTVGI